MKFPGATAAQSTPPGLRKNNFDLLRFLAAGAVCLIHIFTVSQIPELHWLREVLSPDVAIRVFFVISGFLVFMSFENSHSIRQYASNRVRRIYPAYLVVILMCALGLAVVSTKPLSEYFGLQWLRYLAANLAFQNYLQPTLPGVFESNAINIVNGALWTLKVEAMFYVAVPIIVLLFRRLTVHWMMASLYILSVAYMLLFETLADATARPVYSEIGRQLPGQLKYFLAGAFFFYYMDFFERHRSKFLIAVIPVLLLDLVYPLPALEPFALATVVISLATFRHLGNFGKHGDFSYGIYIVHFPIIQLLLLSQWPHAHPYTFLLTAIVATLCSGFSMWHLVEKRFLARSNHYVSQTALTGERRLAIS